MDPQTNNTPKNTAFRFILLLVFIGFAFLLFFLYQTRKTTEEQQNFVSVTPPPSDVALPTRSDVAPVVQTMGSFSLKSASEVNSGGVNKFLNLDVIASSDQKSIVGYDLVVEFEEGTVDIVQATSLLADFNLYPAKKSDHYIVTGVKKLSSRKPTRLNDTPIIRLKVVPKKAGVLILTIVDKLGLEKTQMVDERTNILVPKVGQITLEVR